jgi:DNA-binding IscR family transcriptional regulator
MKGAQGGYQLARPAKEITVYEILSAIETSLFEKTEFSDDELQDAITSTMKNMVFDKMDDCLREALSRVTLADMAAMALEKSQDYMYYL